MGLYSLQLLHRFNTFTPTHTNAVPPHFFIETCNPTVQAHTFPIIQKVLALLYQPRDLCLATCLFASFTDIHQTDKYEGSHSKSWTSPNPNFRRRPQNYRQGVIRDLIESCAQEIAANHSPGGHYSRLNKYSLQASIVDVTFGFGNNAPSRLPIPRDNHHD